MSVERLERYSRLAGNFALTAEIDLATAEVASAFGIEGIETLVLKGPVIARWLYPGEVRPCSDSDLMVAPRDRACAVDVLERLGFTEHLPYRPIRLSLDPGGTPFSRSGIFVDLHCQLPGLKGDPDAVWVRLAASADRQVIGGVELRVPDRDTVLLHVVLHAAYHANLVDGNPREDLKRALALVEESKWSNALALACAYEGLPAFAAGLRLLPEGEDVACKLDLGDVRSLQHEFRHEDNVMAEELYAMLSADADVRQKLAIAARDIFPRPDYMRWSSRLAQRGKLGLACAYVWRVMWLIGQAPAGIHTLWRIRQTTRRA
ncbi:MAG TPA: nucleotidyltransferase family protein [Solirubrobacteraceae bacterium]|nr:nucleotidyltransferase family protein [Solirubrobacteraceae bacterium]